ncbi:MAG: C10 family peptidase [Prevotella sp.]|nr:C10 family peptidase [Prevotella sp.]
MKKAVTTILALFIFISGASAQLIPPGAEYKSSVQPLLKTTWSQSAPYNQYCPTKTNSSGEQENCPVGCVALAIGQIMKYHNYPETGKGSKSYQPLGVGAVISADFENTQYKWSLMKNSYTRFGSTKFYTDEEADAVATMLFHAGVSVGTIYALSGSSAFAYGNIPRDLVENFRYSEDSIRYVSRADYTKEEWMNLIYNELSMGRPVFYAGNSPTFGGHAFVIDGYDSTGRVHINWGWRGSDDGYYDIDLTEGENNYSKNQSMVIGIMPPSSTETAISQPEAEERVIEKIFNANGIQTDRLQRGMNIIRYTDGTTRKIMVR